MVILIKLKFSYTFINNEEPGLLARLESLFEPIGSGSEVFETRLVSLKLKLGF